MFPIPSGQTLSFTDIANYWSREIKPSASPRELRDKISEAWWRGELVAANGPSRVHLLRSLYSKCADYIAFAIPGAPEPPCFRVLDDGSVEVYRLVTVPLPNAQPDTWIDANCAEAFNAIAEAWDEKAFDLLALEVPFIVLTRTEFIQWAEKFGYTLPTFWGQTSQLVGATADQKTLADGIVPSATRSKRLSPRRAEEFVREYCKKTEMSGGMPSQDGARKAALDAGYNGARGSIDEAFRKVKGPPKPGRPRLPEKDGAN
jgi:hypothetical protein